MSGVERKRAEKRRGFGPTVATWNPATWIEDSRQFLVEVRSEYRKVTWPTRKEAVAGTIGVLVVVSVITAVLSLIDLVLSQVIQLVVP
jgi:preprotein translocase subunit SecE